jgi:hypothetical protein
MAAQPVAPEQYPELDTFELTSEFGGSSRFVGRIVGEAIACRGCSETIATSYRGPQHGLAFDVPETPFDVAPVELELTWCPQCGATDMQLYNQDGGPHTGL